MVLHQRGARRVAEVAGGTLLWAGVGGGLGAAACGLYGLLCGLLWAALGGGLTHLPSLALGFVAAGAAAGAIVGACSRLLDGHNPLARSASPDAPPVSEADKEGPAPRVVLLHPGPSDDRCDILPLPHTRPRKTFGGIGR